LNPAQPQSGRDRSECLFGAPRYGLPAIYPFREHALAGGLISYGTSVEYLYRQVGIYTGRILKGEKPANLPVEQHPTFGSSLNMLDNRVDNFA
jgi:putative ABC transport system substrate-binding protein